MKVELSGAQVQFIIDGLNSVSIQGVATAEGLLSIVVQLQKALADNPEEVPAPEEASEPEAKK